MAEKCVNNLLDDQDVMRYIESPVDAGKKVFGYVAQLVRASGSYPLGPGFKSLCSHSSFL